MVAARGQLIRNSLLRELAEKGHRQLLTNAGLRYRNMTERLRMGYNMLLSGSFPGDILSTC